MDTKEANYFMGPTLYDSSPDPAKRNLVGKLSEPCKAYDDDCYLLHADMLHEAPDCGGLLHDPETASAYGTAYWYSDGWNQELVRLDFQQPHGPGFMDHSIAAVRRYPDVPIQVRMGAHAGLAFHASTSMLFAASTNEGVVRAFTTTSGTYAGTAREAYPIFSSRLPSFEYSIYGCADVRVFASGLSGPTGLAIANDRLFVAELDAARISVYAVASGALLDTLQLPGVRPQGIAFAPLSGLLYITDTDADRLLRVDIAIACTGTPTPALNPAFAPPSGAVLQNLAPDCSVTAAVPDEKLFDQVHVDTGYAAGGAAQNDTMMDASAALLAARSDCGNSTLNFDALLLGGYYCHVCLPTDLCAATGGTCANVQWSGYVCDNEILISTAGTMMFRLNVGRTYRVVNDEPGCGMLELAEDYSGVTLTRTAGDPTHGGEILMLFVGVTNAQEVKFVCTGNGLGVAMDVDGYVTEDGTSEGLDWRVIAGAVLALPLLLGILNCVREVRMRKRRSETELPGSAEAKLAAV